MPNDNLNINTSTSQRKAIETHWIWVRNRDGKRVRVAEYQLAQGVAA